MFPESLSRSELVDRGRPPGVGTSTRKSGETKVMLSTEAPGAWLTREERPSEGHPWACPRPLPDEF